MKHVTAACVGFRVLIAVFTVTFFQPDEYFQSLEPAHKLVFGYGELTWEWIAVRPIRSIFHPALFAPLYWLLKITRLDSTVLLVCGDLIVFRSGSRVATDRTTENASGSSCCDD